VGEQGEGDGISIGLQERAIDLATRIVAAVESDERLVSDRVIVT